ncbi:MAG: VCBS repeat-containing protein, partial [Bacteroidota bacterium]
MSTQKNRTRRITRLVVFLGLGLIVLVVGGRFAIKTFAGEDALNIASGFIQQAFGGEVPDYAPSTELFTPVRTEIELDETIKPFKQIGERLGDGATGNNFVTMRGVAVFDANGDGLMDLYFPQYGRLTSKKNDENHVLQPSESNEAKPSMLYLNMGNDENGEPIYKSVPDLMREKGDLTNAQAELLTENKYVPRTSPEEDPYGVGRIGWGAAAADFNADGRMDLLVLNHHYGMGFVELEYGVTIFPPTENIGRGESGYKSIKTALPPYLKGDMQDGAKLMVNFSGKEEPEGRNTLYLNMGDT